MCTILVPDAPLLVYDEDPFVTLFTLHQFIDPLTRLDEAATYLTNASRSVWGPAAWRLLHKTARDTPQHTMDLLECYTEMLPCDQCRRNLCKHMQDIPHGNNMVEYAAEIHDQVNVALGKPRFQTQ